MEYLINLALGVIGSLIAAEIIFRHKRWCRRIIHRAAARIKDPAQSAIKLEEWLAALEEHIGILASFSHAIGCWTGAPAVAAALKQPVSKKSSTTRSRRRPKNSMEVLAEGVSEEALLRTLKILREQLNQVILSFVREVSSLLDHIADKLKGMLEAHPRIAVPLSIMSAGIGFAIFKWL